MRIFVLSPMLCGFCFGQATRQVISKSVCSFNVSNVQGSVSTTISGPACNNFSEALMGLLQEDVLREDIEARKSQRLPNATLASFSSIEHLPLNTGLTAGLYDLNHIADLQQAAGPLSIGDITNYKYDPTLTGLQQPAGPLFGATAINVLSLSSTGYPLLGSALTATGTFDLTHISGLHLPAGLSVTSDTPTSPIATFGSMPLPFTNTTLTGTDQFSWSKTLSDITAGAVSSPVGPSPTAQLNCSKSD